MVSIYLFGRKALSELGFKPNHGNGRDRPESRAGEVWVGQPKESRQDLCASMGPVPAARPGLVPVYRMESLWFRRHRELQ